METRNQRFKRLAEARTNKALDRIRIIGNLSAKASYSWDQKDINKIFKAIEEEIEIVKAKFRSSYRASFSLGDKNVAKPSKSPVERTTRAKKAIVKRIAQQVKEKIKEEIKIDPCSNCFENRLLKPYRTLSLCKRCYRQRKTIYKIQKINGEKNLRSLVI